MSAFFSSRSALLPSRGASAMPMLAPMTTSWPLIWKGSAKLGDQALGERGGLLRVAQGILQDHELVAAEAGDDVGAAHGVAQPVGDGAQELVAAGMPQRVVDLLELVEVDEVDGKRAAAAQARHRRVHLVAEERAVGQPGQRIVARQLVDLGLGHRAVGDVLEQHDAAAVGHRVEGERERAAALASRRRARRRPRPRGRSRIPPPGARASALDSVPALTQARMSSRAEARLAAMSRGTPSSSASRLLRDRDAALGVEHAQPVRHVVERGVEPPRQQAHVAAGHDRVEQDAAQPVGDEFHASTKNGTSTKAKIV